MQLQFLRILIEVNRKYMCTIDKELLDYLWEMAFPVDGFNQERYRHDACGAWIEKDKYDDRYQSIRMGDWPYLSQAQKGVRMCLGIIIGTHQRSWAL